MSSKGGMCPCIVTTLPLLLAGVFTQSTFVVSMRLCKQADVEKVRKVTRPFVLTDGEPIAWGWDAVETLAIGDFRAPEWVDFWS